MRGHEVQAPTEKAQCYAGFLSNTGLDPLKKHKTTKPAFKVLAIIGPPAKRHLNGVLLAGRSWPAYSGIWIHTPLINYSEKKSEVDPL